MTIDLYCESIKKDSILQGFAASKVNYTPYALYSYVDPSLFHTYVYNQSFKANLRISDKYLVPF